jgi:hypothetical protein
MQPDSTLTVARLAAMVEAAQRVYRTDKPLLKSMLRGNWLDAPKEYGWPDPCPDPEVPPGWQEY